MNISQTVQNAVRSWRFLAAYVAFTILWWAVVGPRLNDPWPYVGYTTVISVGTWLDLIIVGIGQKEQTNRDSQNIALLVQLARNDDAQLEALAAAFDELGKVLPMVQTMVDPRGGTQI